MAFKLAEADNQEGRDKKAETKSYSYGFEVGGYDRTKDLVLDPATLVYCGYVGGDGLDYGNAIAVDASGNAYIAGYASSWDLPTAVGPALAKSGGDFDAFVAKVKADGSGLVYCGYIGGSGDFDAAYGIAVDGSGNAYVTGSTDSTEASFPKTVGPGLTYKGGTDAFVAKVNSTGSALDYCGYIGGSSKDVGRGIAVDGSGNAYVTGYTSSTELMNFPVTGGPDSSYNGSTYDAFVAKVNSTGSALDYCGYIGGSGIDVGYGIAVDGSGNAYITGRTVSTEASFPVTGGPDSSYNGGSNDAFVAKVNSTGSALDYCGYVGGSGIDVGCGIAVDGSGNAYITGYTASTEASFPVTVGPDLCITGARMLSWPKSIRREVLSIIAAISADLPRMLVMA